ncbi:SDR family oxidoreductase [Brevibacillus dissolubilis]|uniref:SDR family oxidoreductase n=1 Tax=Brevibacillus dissolubilis TaxID=1844116 RepID=UPI0011173154|nr:SDR family oxidoreductase [Brevibacillus dissolubilis]
MSTLSINRPVALVTGSSSGFGLLASIALAQEGYQVIATMRNPARKTALVSKAREAGVEASIDIIELDVTHHAQVKQVVNHVVQHYGRIDLLLNNAGFAAGGFIEEIPMEMWREQFETNFFGVVAVTQAVLPHMREAQSGLILTLGSISGLFGFPSLGPYVSSKHAIEGFCESLRLEMNPYGVKVVLIEPGSYQTDIWNKSLEQVEKPIDSPYTSQMERIIQSVKQTAATASDPQEVIGQIIRIVRTPNPRLRYIVGKGTKTMLFFKRILPWKWIEQIVTRQIGR